MHKRVGASVGTVADASESVTNRAALSGVRLPPVARVKACRARMPLLSCHA